jgi:long-subunit fatty acid transport protein
MKKFFAVALVAMMTMTANAQVYVGGTVGFKSLSCDGTSATSFAINPELGYNLNENWAIGLSIGYLTNNIDYDKNGGFAGKLDKNVNTFAVSPYVRYTCVKLDKVNLFVDGFVSYANTGNSDVKVNAFGLGIQPGVAVNLNEKISFVAKLGQIGWSTAKADVDGAKAVNEIDFSLNSLAALNFGLYFNF